MGLSAKGACTKAPVCSHTGTVEQEWALTGPPTMQLSATWPLAGPNEHSQAICPASHWPMLSTADRPLRICRDCPEDKKMSTEILQFLSAFDKRLQLPMSDVGGGALGKGLLLLFKCTSLNCQYCTFLRYIYTMFIAVPCLPYRRPLSCCNASPD
jgi:hypothetical protein